MMSNVCVLILTTLVPIDVMIMTPPSQDVGGPLTLQCDITTVAGIVSTVDIIWSNSSTELDRISNVTPNIANASVVYSDSYTIPQLTTSYHGREIRCEVVINIPETPVRDNATIILNVTGKSSSVAYSTYH